MHCLTLLLHLSISHWVSGVIGGVGIYLGMSVVMVYWVVGRVFPKRFLMYDMYHIAQSRA